VRVGVCVCVSVRIQVLRQNPGRMLTHLVRTIGRRGVGQGFVCLCVLHACVCVCVFVNNCVTVKMSIQAIFNIHLGSASIVGEMYVFL
jgi:hypothetical protein